MFGPKKQYLTCSLYAQEWDLMQDRMVLGSYR